jgi:Domain of unknown function (DUF4386)
MTRKANARLAGFMFLFYIACAFPQMLLYNRAAAGDGIAAKLASIAQHVPTMRWIIVLELITFVDAVALAVALYGLTRDEDQELATFALACRVGEGIINALPLSTLGLLWLATDATKANAQDLNALNALGSLLLQIGQWKTLSAATCFAVGSTIFAYLFLRARSIPLWLAWVGVLGSLLIVILLPLQLAGFASGLVTQLMWIPIAVFEIVFGVWLLFKVPAPAPARH